MNDNTDEEDSAEACKDIREMIEEIEQIVDGKLMDRVVSAFAYVLAENCVSDDHSAELASDMTMKLICGYVQIKNAQRGH